NVEGHPSLARLAQRIGGSPYHLQRNFKRIVGVTPREYADAVRLRTVKRKLREGEDVTGAMLDAGDGSTSRFYERAATTLGMPPRVYRRGGAGGSGPSGIAGRRSGRLRLAVPVRGVCGVTRGARAAPLPAGSATNIRRRRSRKIPVRCSSGLQPSSRTSK